MRSFVIPFLFVLAACRSTELVPEPPLQSRRVVEIARWDAFDGSHRLGELVLLEILDPRGPVRFYQIEDRAGRLVGSATENGRFSRRVPFRDDEEDLGVWRRERGVGLLFGLDRAVDLRSKPAEAGASKARRE